MAPPRVQEWPNAIGFGTDHPPSTRTTTLSVSGRIPGYVSGLIYRIGPGQRIVQKASGGTVEIGHLFDGLTVLHEFRISQSPSSQLTSEQPVTVTHRCNLTASALSHQIAHTGQGTKFSFGGSSDSLIGTVLSSTVGTSLSKLRESIFHPAWSEADLALLAREQDQAVNVGVTVAVGVPVLKEITRKALQQHPTKTQDGPPEDTDFAIFARTDAPFTQPISARTLQALPIIRHHAVSPLLTEPISCSHPEVDPFTGSVYNFTLDPRPRPQSNGKGTYTIFELCPLTQQPKILSRFFAPSAYIHSFFQTRNFIILCAWGARHLWHGAALLLYRNIRHSVGEIDRKTETAEWVVVDKRTGGVVGMVKSDPFFAFHAINAWEEDEEEQEEQEGGNEEWRPEMAGKRKQKTVRIVAEIPIYDRMEALSRFYYHNLLRSKPGGRGCQARSKWARFVLPSIPAPSAPPELPQTANGQLPRSDPQPVMPSLLSATVVSPSVAPQSFDLPTINPAFSARPHRYVYGALDRGMSTFVDGVVKFDSREAAGCRCRCAPTGRCDRKPAHAKQHNPGEDWYTVPRNAAPLNPARGDGKESVAEDGPPMVESNPRVCPACTIWSVPNHTPTEPLFVADPDGKEEDDGAVVTVVLDGLAKRSYLLVLDGRTLQELGRAEMPLPQVSQTQPMQEEKTNPKQAQKREEDELGAVIPFTFHGIHVPEKELPEWMRA